MTVKPSGYKSAIVSIAGLALPLVLFVVATPYAMASFGEESFGLLLFLLSLQALALSIDFGLSSGGVVLIARHLATGDTVAASRVLTETVFFFFIIGVTVVASVYGITGIIDEGKLFGHDATYVIGLIRVMVLGVFIGMLSNALSLFLRALEQIPFMVLIQNVSGSGLWLGVLLVAMQGGGLMEVLLVALGLYCLQLVLFVVWLIRSSTYHFQPLTGGGWHLHGIMGYSGFAFISQLSSMVTYHVDRILVGILSSVGQVAYYAVPANIVSRLLNVGALFNSFVFPRAIALHAAGNDEGLRALYLKASRYTFLLLVPVLVPLLVFIPELLQLWLGEAFAESSQMTARILLLAFFIATTSITPSQIYNGMGNSRIGAAYSLVGSVINLLLCLILIPLYGATGAAIASLVAMLQALHYRHSLEKVLQIDRRKQAGLHFTIAMVALAQGGICGVIHGIGLVFDVISAFFVLAGVWISFYLLWLALPDRISSPERELCRNVIARVGL